MTGSPSVSPSPRLEQEHSSGTAVILAIAVAFTIGSLTRHVLQIVPMIPYTIVLFVWGLIIGFIASFSTEVANYTTLTNIDPHIFTHMFLPVLIFESAFSLDVRLLKNVVVDALLLAVPGLLFQVVLVAVVCMLIFKEYAWGWGEAMLLGAIASATDPVAVVALLRDLGCSPRVSTLIESESLLNDGTAIVLFKVLYNIVVLTDPALKGPTDPGSIVGLFLWNAIGGPVLGLIVGWVFVRWIGLVFNDPLIEIPLTISAAYFTFWLAECKAVSVSGVLAVMMLGIYMNYSRTAISPEVEHIAHWIWKVMEYLANTMIFLLVGAVVIMKPLQAMQVPSACFSHPPPFPFTYIILLHLQDVLIQCIPVQQVGFMKGRLILKMSPRHSIMGFHEQGGGSPHRFSKRLPHDVA